MSASDSVSVKEDVETPSFIPLTRDIQEKETPSDPETVLRRTEDAEKLPRNLTKVRWIAVVLALYSTGLLYGMDTTIVADVQVPIINSLGHIEQLTWIGAGFPLGSVAVILPVGILYSLFNIKWVYITSFLFFEVGSALCGAAPTMNALIIGRVIAGIGGLNYFASLTTIRERPLYTAGIGLLWGVGAILGPVVGGAFAKSSATWRWSFYLNLVIAAISAPIFIFILPPVRPMPNVSNWSKVKSFDFLGTLLNAGCYTAFILLFTFGGGLWAWDDGHTIAMYVVLGVLLITYTTTQYFAVLTTPANRVFPGHPLRSRTMILLHVCTAAVSTNLFLPVYYIPLFFQFTHGDDSLQAAVRLLPFILIGVFTTMVNGALMPKFGYYMPWYILSGVSSLIGGALMFTVDAKTSSGMIYGYSIPIAIGAGASLQVGYSVAAAIVKPLEVPSAIGFINMAQLGGTTIALTIAGQVFQSYAFKNVKAALDGLDFINADIHGAISGTQSALLKNLSADVQGNVLQAIVSSIQRCYILIIVSGAVTLVAACFMKREKLFLEMTAGG
ncbi:MFS general substrate transporter [Stipitochalara longipes BDJ]|nr:MFS general substrate transporter [Stipitochalara longipes BDJ]